MTLAQAAQQALDVQDSCNLSGVLNSLHTIVMDVLWPQATGGMWWVNRHPIVRLFLYKLSALNGQDRTLESEYTDAMAACSELARTEVKS